LRHGSYNGSGEVAQEEPLMKVIQRLKTLLKMIYTLYRDALFAPPPSPGALTREAIQEQEEQRALRDMEDAGRRQGGEA
jgi:hypothetical protein